MANLPIKMIQPLSASLSERDKVEIVTSRHITSRRQLRMATSGKGRSGKTHMAATAPTGVGLIPLDPNSLPTFQKVEKDYGLEGQFFYPKHALITAGDIHKLTPIEREAIRLRRLMEEPANAANRDLPAQVFQLEAQLKDFYRAICNRVVDILGMYEDRDDIKTICIDTGSQLYDFLTFANFGKQSNNRQRTREGLNSEMRNICNGTDKHLIITHPLKAEYKPKPGQKEAEATGLLVLDGWPQMHITMNVCVEHFKIDTVYERRAFLAEQKVYELEDLEALEFPIFGVRLYDSQANSSLNRDSSILLADSSNFIGVAMAVYPDSKEEDWM